MNRALYIALIVAAILNGCGGTDKNTSDPERRGDLFVDSLLSVMTLEEKVGQMTNLSLMALATGDFWDRRDTVVLDTAKMRLYLSKYGVGSFQNLGTYPFSPSEWRQNIALIQKYVSENTRLGIPVLYGIDAVHGANYSAGSTLFPHQIGLAATRNRKLVEETARIAAYEVRASGIHWNYAPVIDVARNAWWGRTFETFGEDPYLVSEMGVASLHGSRNDSLSSPYSTLSCLKHFLAYGYPHSGKDRAPVFISPQQMREIHLPPFKSAIEAGALTVMLGSHSVNGVPCHADSALITGLLKTELGFEGFVISDWNDVDNLVSTHRVARNEREAVKLAVNAGLDMCMEPYDSTFTVNLIDLVKSGEVSESRIDDAVRRILKAKYELGLFSKVQSDPELYAEYGSEKFSEVSYNAAVESLTLLKNKNNRLPIPETKKVLVTGFASHSINVLNGAWSRTWLGRDTSFNDADKETIREAMKLIGGKNVRWTMGSSYDEEADLQEALLQSKWADEIVLCLGELPATEKPGDIEELALPAAQLNLVKALAATGKPITLVLVEGRPRIIREIEPLADAILLAYLPGNEGGRAIADAIYGRANPSGKLPFTYPRYEGSVLTYDHARADERDAGFGFEGFNPQYPFGHGLSYTQFAYSNLELEDTLEAGTDMEIKVTIENTGERAGMESVSLYFTDLVASMVPDVRELAGFEKVSLGPGEKIQVRFNLSGEALGFVDKNGNWKTETGEFRVEVGNLEGKFYLKKSKGNGNG